jgi:hypothetical protein
MKLTQWGGTFCAVLWHPGGALLQMPGCKRRCCYPYRFVESAAAACPWPQLTAVRHPQPRAPQQQHHCCGAHISPLADGSKLLVQGHKGAHQGRLQPRTAAAGHQRLRQCIKQGSQGEHVCA